MGDVYHVHGTSECYFIMDSDHIDGIDFVIHTAVAAGSVDRLSVTLAISSKQKTDLINHNKQEDLGYPKRVRLEKR